MKFSLVVAFWLVMACVARAQVDASVYSTLDERLAPVVKFDLKPGSIPDVGPARSYALSLYGGEGVAERRLMLTNLVVSLDVFALEVHKWNEVYAMITSGMAREENFSGRADAYFSAGDRTNALANVVMARQELDRLSPLATQAKVLRGEILQTMQRVRGLRDSSNGLNKGEKAESGN